MTDDRLSFVDIVDSIVSPRAKPKPKPRPERPKIVEEPDEVTDEADELADFAAEQAPRPNKPASGDENRETARKGPSGGRGRRNSRRRNSRQQSGNQPSKKPNRGAQDKKAAQGRGPKTRSDGAQSTGGEHKKPDGERRRRRRRRPRKPKPEGGGGQPSGSD